MTEIKLKRRNAYVVRITCNIQQQLATNGNAQKWRACTQGGRAHGVDPRPPGPAGLQGGGDSRKPTETVLRSPTPEKIKPEFGTISELSEWANRPPSRRACLPLLAGALAAYSAPTWAQGSKSGFEQWVEAFRARARAAWRLGRDLHAGHEQYQARHRGL